MKYLALTPAYPPRNAAMTPVVERFLRMLNMPGYIISEDSVYYNEKKTTTIQSSIEINKIAQIRYEYWMRFVSKMTSGFWPDKWQLWGKHAFMEACRVLNSNDDIVMIITFSSPISSHLQGIKLKKKYPRIKWIAYMADPIVNSIFYHRTTEYYRNVMQVNERRIIEKSDATVTLSKSHYYQLHEKYKHCNIHYVPHSYSDYSVDECETKPSKGLSVAHFGNLYHPRSIEPYTAVMDAENLPDGIKFYNYGSIGDEDKYLASLYSNLVIHDALPYNEFVKKIRTMDALVLIEGGDSSSSIYLPSKLIEYIGADKPVFGLCYPGSEGERICKEMNFPTANVTNKEQCRNKMLSFLFSLSNAECLVTSREKRQLYTIEKTRNAIRILCESLLGKKILITKSKHDNAKEKKKAE